MPAGLQAFRRCNDRRRPGAYPGWPRPLPTGGRTWPGSADDRPREGQWKAGGDDAQRHARPAGSPGFRDPAPGPGLARRGTVPHRTRNPLSPLDLRPVACPVAGRPEGTPGTPPVQWSVICQSPSRIFQNSRLFGGRPQITASRFWGSNWYGWHRLVTEACWKGCCRGGSGCSQGPSAPSASASPGGPREDAAASTPAGCGGGAACCRCCQVPGGR